MKKRKVIRIKHPIETGDDDWAIAVTKSYTILYSRYPFVGKQRTAKMKGDFRKWSNERWSHFLEKVKRLERFSHGLVGKISRLRVNL